MADPLTALMYAVQVMNFLKSLIFRTLKEREDFLPDSESDSHLEPFDENGHQSPPQLYQEDTVSDDEQKENPFISKKLNSDSTVDIRLKADFQGEGTCRCGHLIENTSCFETRADSDLLNQHRVSYHKAADWHDHSNTDLEKRRVGHLKEVSNLSRIDCQPELIEAWL